MRVKVLKLINNERINKKLVSAKACGDETAVDYCGNTEKDYADCSVYAYDECMKDYAGCTEGVTDICYLDYAACFGAGEEDVCGYRDLDAN